MAALKIKFLAASIKMQMHLLVFLPESVVRKPGALKDSGLKVLWLLHGEGGDCSDWIRLSLVEHYAQEANIALVMPNLDNSMCMDMAHGGYPYFTYLTEDVPFHVRNLVQVLSDRKEDNFVAGVSTGGYGAVKWMLRAPQMFSGSACLSGDIDMVSALRRKEEAGTLTDDWIAAFGDSARLAETPDDNLYLCKQRKETSETLPSIYLACSKHDEGFQRSKQAAQTLRDLGVGVHCHEGPNEHGWRFWDARIRDFIETVVKPGREGGG